MELILKVAETVRKYLNIEASNLKMCYAVKYPFKVAYRLQTVAGHPNTMPLQVG